MKGINERVFLHLPATIKFCTILNRIERTAIFKTRYVAL